MTEHKDIPLEECQTQIDKFFETHPHAEFYQKFTCVNCGQRLTIEEPNIFYTSGRCDKCDYVTDIRVHGCGYLLVLDVRTK